MFSRAIVGLFALVLVSACGNSTGKEGGSAEPTDNSAPSVESITGTWNLVKYSSEKDPEAQITECDKASPWNFTNEPAEPLSDGTEVQKLKVAAPDTCKWFGFETKWTVANGKLFMGSTKIGGMGGLSLAGSITIESFNGSQMVLTSHGNTLEFARQ